MPVFSDIIGTKANELDPLESIELTQLVILPDPVTGKLYKSTVGALLNAGTPIDLSLKADLVSGKVPSYELPSYVDDVLEYPTVADLPTTGATGVIYVITTGADSGKVFRWSGTMYVQVGGTGDGSDVAAEAATRAAADITLQNNINAEALARANADNTLQSNINAEAAARAGADTTLQSNINAEATTRANADITLQDNINGEANARSNADSALQNNITAEAIARIAADNTEISARIAADAVLQAEIDALSGNKNGLISGGFVTWISGLTFNVSPAVYAINGVAYASPSTDITLNTADPTNDRLDAIALNTSNSAIKITGIAATNPEVPQVDPATQLQLTIILVAAGATGPSNITELIVFDENTEFAVSSAAITLDANDTTHPKTGTKNLNVGTTASGNNIIFQSASPLVATDYTGIKLFLFLKAAVASSINIQVAFYNNTTLVSNLYAIAAANGFTKAYLGGYQTIAIPISQFTFTSVNFNRLVIRFTGVTGGLWLDDFTLQKGAQAPQQWATEADLLAEVANRTAADALKLNIADYNDRFKGKYTTLVALQAAHPTSNVGDYAQVDAGSGSNVINYNWDSNEGWVQGSSAGGGAWGTITGTLADQTDLQTALNNKVDANVAVVGATKTKITYDAKGLVTAGANATTADIADSTDKRYVTDAEKTVIDNTSGINTGDQDLSGKVDANGAIVGATKTKITYDAKGLVTAGANATTADIADSTDKRYVTDAEKTIIDNTSGVNTGDQDLSGKVDANGAISASTKTKITYDAKGLVTAGANATTADIADSTDKRYVTDAEKTIIDNTSGVNTGDEVFEYANLAAFPGTGTAGFIYVAQDTNYIYRWSGSAYVQVGGGSVADASSTVKGILKLTNELGGTAALPTIDNAAVIAKILAGFISTTGTVTSADSILSALEKLAGNHDAAQITINQKISSIAGNYSQSIM